MSLTGGKRKANKGLKAWVTFVKKVQKEEKLSYKDAIHRAKVRKDKGEKWMVGGENTVTSTPTSSPIDEVVMEDVTMPMEEVTIPMEEEVVMGGRRRRRTMRKRSSRRARTARRARGRSSRRR